jgi:hypothetical protein
MMIHPSKSAALAVAGTIVAAGLITLMTPKAVHAVAAALVQVTNTASNPVVTQSIGQQAAQSIDLDCVPSDSPGNGSCYVVTNGFRGSTPYVVPANQSLVITAVDVYTFVADNEAVNGEPACNAGREDAVSTSGGSPLVWEIVNNTSPTHFTYPSGVVFGPSSPLTSASKYYIAGLTAECGGDQILLYGYLTAS